MKEDLEIRAWILREIHDLRRFYPAVFPLRNLSEHAFIEGIDDEGFLAALDSYCFSGALVITNGMVLETLTGERLRKDLDPYVLEQPAHAYGWVSREGGPLYA